MSVPDEANVKRAAVLDTATLSDALDRLRIVGQCAGIKPRDTKFRLAGRAFTLQYGPAASPPGTVGDYIDDVPPGDVIALDNGGREDVTVWGDILTEIAHRRGLARHRHPWHLPGRVACVWNSAIPFTAAIIGCGPARTGSRSISSGTAVDLGGVRVCAGDLLRGDADGVIGIPRDHENEVLDVAEEIERAENEIRAAVRAGMRLDEARRQFNYHQLQRRGK